MIQVACDRCSVGVMDATNPHMTDSCPCACHDGPRCPICHETDGHALSCPSWWYTTPRAALRDEARAELAAHRGEAHP